MLNQTTMSAAAMNTISSH